jgi:hypothetical protein
VDSIQPMYGHRLRSRDEGLGVDVRKADIEPCGTTGIEILPRTTIEDSASGTLPGSPILNGMARVNPFKGHER